MSQLGGAGGRWQKADRLNHEWWKDDGDNGGKVDRQGGPLADNRPETEDRKNIRVKDTEGESEGT